MRKEYLVVAVVALGAGVALGFLLADWRVPDAPSPPVTTTHEESRSFSNPRERARSGPDSAEAAMLVAAARPPGTLAETLRLRGDFAQTAALYQLAAGANRQELEVLLEEAAQIEQPSESRAATSILYARYAALDPAAALEHLLRRGGGHDFSHLGTIIHGWSRSNLDAAIAAIHALPAEARTMAALSLLNARDDLPQAERERLAEELGVRHALGQIDQRRTLLRPTATFEEAWQEALGNENPARRVDALSSVASVWGARDPEAAVAAAASLPAGTLRQRVEQHVLQSWANADPREVVAWALSQADSRLRQSGLQVGITALAAREPAAALELVAELPDSARRMVLPHVIVPLAARDPVEAIRWFETLEDSQLRTMTAHQIGHFYARQEPDAAAEWAAGLEGTEQLQAWLGVIQGTAAHDPQLAARLVSEIESAQGRQQAAAAVARAWARWSPEAAAQWSSQLRDAPARETALAGALSQWAQSDRSAALAFAESLRNRSDRELGIATLIPFVADDLDAAERLFERVADSPHKQRAAAALFHRFREIDPERAERYREAAGIDRRASTTGAFIISSDSP